MWAGAGSNRRPLAFQVSRPKRCADLRLCRTSMSVPPSLERFLRQAPSSLPPLGGPLPHRHQPTQAVGRPVNRSSPPSRDGRGAWCPSLPGGCVGLRHRQGQAASRRPALTIPSRTCVTVSEEDEENVAGRAETSGWPAPPGAVAPPTYQKRLLVGWPDLITDPASVASHLGFFGNSGPPCRIGTIRRQLTNNPFQ